jgi:hypothetical protein
MAVAVTLLTSQWVKRFWVTRCFLIDWSITLDEQPRMTSVPLVSTQDQLDWYIGAHRPALLHGALSGWPALSKWSPAFFAQEIGEQLVEVYTWGRSGSDWRRTRLMEITLASYVDLLQRHEQSAGDGGMIGAPYLQEDEWLFADHEVRL